jgi:enoyl-CoA hydratase/carnithine racemase
VRIERDGPVGTIVFDHQARRNAMSLDMWRQVPPLCEDLQADREIRVVVLRGAGETAFVAGADISQFQRMGDSDGDSNSEANSDSAADGNSEANSNSAANSDDGSASGRPGGDRYDRATGEAFGAIAELAKPVVALIHGFCIGGGLAIAAAADIRYAADDARFGLPPARLGVGYSAAGIATLVDLLGPAVTKEIIYTADWYDAETALRWGLVNAVVPKAELDRFVAERAATIAGRAPLSQLAAKLAVADHLRSPEHRRADTVRAAIAACATSDDYEEGVAAFLEKRRPVFRGR